MVELAAGNFPDKSRSHRRINPPIFYLGMELSYFQFVVEVHEPYPVNQVPEGEPDGRWVPLAAIAITGQP